MKDDPPEWLTASDAEYRAETMGGWLSDGRWLLFRDYYFNVMSSERRPIKSLPEDPGEYFRAAAPDLKTIVFEEYCFTRRYDLPKDELRDEIINQQCELSNQHLSKVIVAFWLIDAETRGGKDSRAEGRVPDDQSLKTLEERLPKKLSKVDGIEKGGKRQRPTRLSVSGMMSAGFFVKRSSLITHWPVAPPVELQT